MADPSQVRRITWRSADVARVLGLAFLFVFVWRFFWMVHSAVFLAVLAILIAIIIHVPARFLSRWIPFRLAFVLVLGLFLGGLGLLLVRMIPQLVEQASLLAVQLPEQLESVRTWLREKTGRAASSDALSQNINQQVGALARRFVPLAFNAVTTLLGSFAIVVLAAFLAAEPQTYRDLVLRAAPPERRDTWTRIYDEAGRNLRMWVLGKAASMVAIGVVSYIGLTLFGIPGALALACFAALMEFIPNFGPTIAALPAMVAAFAISPITSLYVAIFYFVLQQVQNSITVPLVERRAVNIPPAALLVWQLMLAVGFGILALFVATPLLTVLVVAVRILYTERVEDLQRWDRRENEVPATAAALANPPEPPDDDADADDGGGSQLPPGSNTLGA
ncbi:MAG TPA: AI-2E family transporter [Longimicrobiaceae bacterium]|nr:AI-2E family transporter [Longimicrobiaceae bacterium]